MNGDYLIGDSRVIPLGVAKVISRWPWAVCDCMVNRVRSFSVDSPFWLLPKVWYYIIYKPCLVLEFCTLIIYFSFVNPLENSNYWSSLVVFYSLLILLFASLLLQLALMTLLYPAVKSSMLTESLEWKSYS